MAATLAEFHRTNALRKREAVFHVLLDERGESSGVVTQVLVEVLAAAGAFRVVRLVLFQFARQCGDVRQRTSRDVQSGCEALRGTAVHQEAVLEPISTDHFISVGERVHRIGVHRKPFVGRRRMATAGQLFAESHRAHCISVLKMNITLPRSVQMNLVRMREQSLGADPLRNLSSIGECATDATFRTGDAMWPCRMAA